MTQTPPYPERLVQQKIPMSLPEFDILDELNNTYVKIPLFQAIQHIPIYEKTIKELYTKKYGRRKRDLPTI